MEKKEKLQVHNVRFFEYQPAPVNCIAYDVNTDRVAVSRSDGSVQILSAADNLTQIFNFPGGADSSVEALVWAQQRLFAAGLGGNVVELDLETPHLIKTSVSSNSGPVWCLTRNPEETQLAAATEDGCVVLYDIEDELQFLRPFAKQDGRIMSIAWHSDSESQENIIVTGGINHIRQWSVNSGQPISRLTVATSYNQDTIVWCVAVTRDFVIISGDSRGTVTFWSGRLSTQIKHFNCHKADVLSLCISEDQKTVFSGGVDAAIYKFGQYAVDEASDRTRWSCVLLHKHHTHDVRAMAHMSERLLSGGLDSVLRVAYDLRGVRKVPEVLPLPAGVLVDLDKEHNLIKLQYKNYLELWRLGAADTPDDPAVGILPLSRGPLKLIELKARESQDITCSAISSNGHLAFSDLQQVRLYRFDVDEATSMNPQLRLERVKHSISQPARLMALTPSGDHLVVVLVGRGGLKVMNTKSGAVKHKLKTDSAIHILRASHDNKHIAYATVNHDVHVVDIQSGEVVCKCPVLASQVSAITFSPHSHTLAIAYCNHKICEMDFVKKQYSPWSRLNSPVMRNSWMQRNKTITNIAFPPDTPHKMYFHTSTCLALMDRKRHTEIRRSFKMMDSLVKKCYKYKYLIHADFLPDGSMVVVERPPAMIDEQLPPSFFRKKFGL